MTTSADKLDHTPLTWGKYKGKTPDQIAETDPSYVVWMFDNVVNQNTCSKLLADACRADDMDDEEDHAKQQAFGPFP